ncbi:DUF1684 domain-containing protein [bacterium BMS3Abin03]|nr:DUF1684 domain-containing protein [bacterium BMS3Abin03]
MKNKFNSISVVVLIIISLIILQYGCGKNSNMEEKSINSLDSTYVQELLKERAEKDSAFQFEAYSPFVRDPKADFKPLKYYKPDPDFIFHSKLYEYNLKDTVDVFGTRGEIRRVVVEGYLILNYKGEEHRINLYKSMSKDGQFYYSLWFTDKTTGKETYGVGRYLDFEKVDDPDHIYTIDFNKAYNPYCAYSSIYTCPIPREEDYLDMKITAGEKRFH